MLSDPRLNSLIQSLSGTSYQSIQKLRGVFSFPRFTFQFLKIQGSPGANPASIATVKILQKASNLPELSFSTSSSRFALADFLIRRFNQGIEKFAQQNRGKDGSGSFHTIALGQKMLQRDSVLLNQQEIELRFIFSLPANGVGSGKFDAEQAEIMFGEELSTIVDFTFYYKNYDNASKKLLNQFQENQNTRETIKQYLEQHGLITFINNAASLPRQSGVCDEPATHADIKKFQSPASCQINIPLTGNKRIEGMAIKQGITCITGGGYHGKSTLMQAILAGVYAHIPDDGREFIVTRDDAVFIRAEEGRSIQQVDISPFIGQLPNGIQTEQFCTDNASGSTSQAASIVEAFEVGSRLLLFDEDTCATNFLIRDELIKKVLDSTKEPIKPLYSTVRSLWKQHKVSMIFVVGGLGSFLQKADCCLLMDNYQCEDITTKVRKQLGAIVEKSHSFTFSNHRYLSADNFDPAYTNQRLKKEIPKRIKDLRNAPKQLEYGMDLINLEALPQLVEAPQMLAIGYCLLFLNAKIQKQSEPQLLENGLEWLTTQLEQHGLSCLQADYPGTLSLPRKYEIAAAINRIRSLKITNEK